MNTENNTEIETAPLDATAPSGLDTATCSASEEYAKIYEILMTHGASESMKESFIWHHVNKECDEWRFSGRLGFGGKYWRKTNDVTCYSEDRNEGSGELIKIINSQLASIL